MEGFFPFFFGFAGAGLEEGRRSGVAGVVEVGGEEGLGGGGQPFEVDEVELVDDGFLACKIGLVRDALSGEELGKISLRVDISGSVQILLWLSNGLYCDCCC